MLGCSVSWPMRLAIIWSTEMPEWMTGPLCDRRAGQQAAGLRGMDALTGGVLVEEPVDHVDLLLQRLERRQAQAELHVGARSFGAPVILVHAVAHEEHREPLRERRARRRRRERGQGIEPRQAHRDAGAAKDRPTINA